MMTRCNWFIFLSLLNITFLFLSTLKKMSAIDSVLTLKVWSMNAPEVLYFTSRLLSLSNIFFFSPKFHRNLFFLTRENDQLSKQGDTKFARANMLDEVKQLIKSNPVFCDKLQYPSFKKSRLRTLINQRYVQRVMYVLFTLYLEFSSSMNLLIWAEVIAAVMLVAA